MALSGFVGAGVQDALSQQLAEQLRQAMFEEEQRQAQAREAMAAREQTRREAEDASQVGFQEKMVDSQERSRRDRSNQAGMEDMYRQRAIMDQEEQGRRIQEVVGAMPDTPVRRVIELQRLGVNGVRPQDTLTPEEQAAARQADLQNKIQETDALEGVRARHRQPPQPQYQRVIVDGKETFLTPEEVRARGGVTPEARRKPVTGMERNNLAFYQRAAQANEIAAPLEGSIGQMSLLGQARLQSAPNFLQSNEGQSYRQAQRAFTEARLRKESGAAIPEGEYQNDARTYFAQPGDSAQTIQQKQAARKQVLEGLALSTGQAWDEYYGEPRQPGGGGGGTSTTIRLQAPNGQIKDVPVADAERYIKAGAKVVQ